MYKEPDIDFLMLSDRQFEELCFDLLLRSGYKRLMWRQGGSDCGRDIEGYLTVSFPVIDSLEEKWFFECKRYRSGVPVSELLTKIAWADAEKPRHFVVIVSSYLSNNTREWLQKIAPQKSYLIHLIEGKKLKQYLLSFPELIPEYFCDKYFKILHESERNWLVHNLLPEPATLNLLASKLVVDKLTGFDMAFLLCSVLLGDDDIQSWCEHNDYFKMDHIFLNLKNRSNVTKPIMEEIDIYTAGRWASRNSQAVAVFGHSGSVLSTKGAVLTTLTLSRNEEETRAVFMAMVLNDLEAVELLVELKEGFPTKIRYIAGPNAAEEVKKLRYRFALEV